MYDMPPLKDCHHPSVRPSVRPPHPTVRPIRPSDRPIMMLPPLSAGPMESPGSYICANILFDFPIIIILVRWAPHNTSTSHTQTFPNGHGRSVSPTGRRNAF